MERFQRYNGKGNPTPEYRVFRSAKRRCGHSEVYIRRGIQFKFTSFEEFMNDIGFRPSSNHSLDRINNDGHYETGNVRWARPFIQQNNRSSNIRIELNGVVKTATEWSRELGIGFHRLRKRIRVLGWCASCALTNEFLKSCPHRGVEFDPPGPTGSGDSDGNSHDITNSVVRSVHGRTAEVK